MVQIQTLHPLDTRPTLKCVQNSMNNEICRKQPSEELTISNGMQSSAFKAFPVNSLKLVAYQYDYYFRTDLKFTYKCYLIMLIKSNSISNQINELTIKYCTHSYSPTPGQSF